MTRGIRCWSYPLAYTLRIALTGLPCCWCCPVGERFPWRCSWLAVAVGLVGGLLWIVICRLRIEDQLLTLVGLGRLDYPGRPPRI